MGSRVVASLLSLCALAVLVGCGSDGGGDTSAALEDVKANMSTKDTPANPTPPQRLPAGVQNAGGGKFSGTGAGR